jgi:hypothetical protein
MSWLFAISKSNENLQIKKTYCHDAPLWMVSTKNFYLAIGGNPDACFWESNQDSSEGWAIAGLGILRTDSRASFLSHAEWANLLSNQSFDPASIDGHFIALRWKENQIECFNDQIGLRTIFWGNLDNGLCLSTRIDWLTRTIGHAEIDFPALGSRLLICNQVSYESGICGIEKLGPGGRAIIKKGSVAEFKYKPWLPSFEPVTIHKASEILKSLVLCSLNFRYIPSLGLSGGLDSRLLLALLMSCSKDGFRIHTFGDENEFDVQIAKEITKNFNLQHKHIQESIPDIQTCISSYTSFIAQTALVEPGTSFLRIRSFSQFRENGKFLIDGGFGELSRCQYLNRIIKLGKSALINKDIPRLFRFLRYPRTDIFSQEVISLLTKGAMVSLEKTLNEMPPIEKIGVQNFADLFSVRTRIPNYGGPEQARLDGIILNLMPLAQPSFLRAVFGIPVKFRSKSRLHYNIISTLAPALKKYPVIKYGFPNRFGRSNNLAWLISKLKSRVITRFYDPAPNLLLQQMREYIMDTIHSEEVSNNTAYNYPKLLDSSTRFYNGELQYGNALNWWLTFELWKRSLSSNGSSA